jgi:hypothetical protein
MIPGQEAIELSIGQSSEIRIYSVSATGLAHTHSKRDRGSCSLYLYWESGIKCSYGEGLKRQFPITRCHVARYYSRNKGVTESVRWERGSWGSNGLSVTASYCEMDTTVNEPDPCLDMFFFFF